MAAALGSVAVARSSSRRQAAAVDELHAEVVLAVVLADLVDRHDARVVEQGDGLGLVLEPAQLVVAGQDAGLDHLEGDGPVEARPAGPRRRRPCRRGPARCGSRSRRKRTSSPRTSPASRLEGGPASLSPAGLDERGSTVASDPPRWSDRRWAPRWGSGRDPRAPSRRSNSRCPPRSSASAGKRRRYRPGLRALAPLAAQLDLAQDQVDDEIRMVTGSGLQAEIRLHRHTSAGTPAPGLVGLEPIGQVVRLQLAVSGQFCPQFGQRVLAGPAWSFDPHRWASHVSSRVSPARIDSTPLTGIDRGVRPKRTALRKSRSSSAQAVFVDLELPGDGVERPGQLFAATLRRAALRLGDLGPGVAIGTEDGDATILGRESAPDPTEQLATDEQAVRVGFAGFGLGPAADCARCRRMSRRPEWRCLTWSSSLCLAIFTSSPASCSGRSRSNCPPAALTKKLSSTDWQMSTDSTSPSNPGWCSQPDAHRPDQWLIPPHQLRGGLGVVPRGPGVAAAGSGHSDPKRFNLVPNCRHMPPENIP